MSDGQKHPSSVPIILWIFAGLLVLATAWLLPVNLRSVTPGILREAGQNTKQLDTLADNLLASQKTGAAALVAIADRSLTVEAALPPTQKQTDLQTRLADVAAQKPANTIWGVNDPFIQPLVKANAADKHETKSTPVLEFFIRGTARENLRDFLSNSRSPGTLALLAARNATDTGRFVPATQPGGQTLDAVLLLGALLYQGEHLGDGLRKEIRRLSEQAAATGNLGDLEGICTDLLSLGKRLDWGQLCALAETCESAAALEEFAYLARAKPDAFPFIYSAALLTNSADNVARYLKRFGEEGLLDLKETLAMGKGALDILLKRQVAINHEGIAQGWDAVASLTLQWHFVALALKYIGFFLGCFLVFHGLERILLDPADASGNRLPRMKNIILGFLTALMLIIGTEPYLIKPAPMTEFKIEMAVPVISQLGTPGEQLTTVAPTTLMDANTLITVGIFLLLQIFMYLFCLWKIRSIEKQNIPDLLKLRLMENEENLFDGGLYIGIAGTAAALVLQVLGIVSPNLLAAYSSNLFGIICVALIKIRQVRPYKHRLIMAGQKKD